MDFDLTDDQQLLIESVRTLLGRRAGPDRARRMALHHNHDDELLVALDDAGFLDIATNADSGPLEAALVVEEIAGALGTIHAGARMLVAPFVLAGDFPNRITLVDDQARGPIRYLHQAEAAIMVRGDDARLVEVVPGSTTHVESIFGYPMGAIEASPGPTLAPGAGDLVRRWWQVALAAEMVGLIRGALDLTVDHVRERTQFGRAIGSFQAIQHRLADLYILTQGARWMTLCAAWDNAESESAAAAAGYASDVAQAAVWELHQLTGAISFTDEYDLHLYTLRLQALRTELGGASRHYQALARARWLGSRADFESADLT
jgi:alkylation response protein AidB-like acyl-CoA dehydrogenase